ncbi:hypothetical protein ERJ70_02305 [Sediminibacillus dalangtanensis]|uniref:DUF1433 domain-containing protein n=1 Tax=Sediminibacillus dalangtanensis TaxID=2729421 RepID=A0ABX7VN48_9BACI|nr:hypothetical protein [Sediminibacillus dalangtanensis]QTM98249.1 hypothetical protein ERJ70_02305 [Sediminibacillus dalangtanensis]
MKKIKYLPIFTLLAIILLGGCNVNQTKNSYDQETISKAKESAKSYIENNYEGIHSIELEEPYQAPMGSMTVDGTVNGEIGFSISLNKDFTISRIGKDEGFPEEKEECKEKTCDY